MKRFLSLMLALCMVLTVLPVTSLAETAQEITLWTFPIGDWGDPDKVQELIDRFEADNPGIEVKVEVLSYMDGDEKLSTAIAGGAAPDLVLEGPERLVANWGEQGLMVDLSGLLDETDKAELHPEALAASYGSDGGLYQYPLGGVVHVMAINKTAFEKADAMKYIDEETHTWKSTDAFFEAVAQVYATTGKTVGTVFCGGMGGDQATRALVTNLYGGTYTNAEHTAYTWDSAENVKALQKLYDSEKIGITFNPEIVGGNEIAMLRSGELSMAFTWNIAQQTEGGKTDSGDEIMFLAFPSDNTPKLQGGIWSLGIFNNGDEGRIEAAKTFVKYMCDSEATSEAVRLSGAFPVRDSAEGNDLSGTWEDDAVRSEFNKLMKLMGDYYQVTPAWREARELWYEMLQQIAAGENIAATAAAFTDAANANIPAQAPDDPEPGTVKTEISVLAPQYGDQSADWWATFEAEFEEAHEDIDLVAEIVPWNDIYGILETRIAGGDAPDILNIDGFAEYQAQDLLLPVKDYMSDETYSKFYPEFLEQSEIDGTIWAVPDLASARGLYYNKDLLEEAGVTEIPSAWFDFEQVCVAIQNCFGDGVIPFGMDISENEGQASFAMYAWNFGGGFVDEEGSWALNSDANVAAVDHITIMVNNGYANGTDANRYDLEKMFLDGKVAMILTSDGFRHALSDINYGVTTLPVVGDQAPVSLGVMDRMMCFDNDYSEEELAAVTAFFDFFYEDNRYSDWVNMEGFMPATSTGTAVLAEKSPSAAPWMDILSNCKFYPADKEEWATVRGGVIEILQAAVNGGDIRAMLNNFQAQITGEEIQKDPCAFASFAELQELVAAGFEGDMILTYIGAEALVIEENLTLPGNLILDCSTQTVLVPGRAALTVENQMLVNDLMVEGTLEALYVEVENSLTVTGNLIVHGNLSMLADGPLEGEENIQFDENAVFCLYAEAKTEEDLQAWADRAEADTNEKHLYMAIVTEELTITESLVLPANLMLYNFAAITVAKGATLTTGFLPTLAAPVLVEGTLNNTSGIYLMEFLAEGTLTIAEGGTYTGEGAITGYFENKKDPAEVIFGLDLSAFDQDYDEETGFWYLYPILEETPGEFSTFAELKELAARTDLEEVLPCTYVGDEPLVIEEDITLPWFLGVACLEQPMVVPEGVTLKAENLMQVGELTVEGSMDVVGIEIYKSLTVNGTLNASAQVLLNDQDVTLEGENNIDFGDGAVLCLCRIVNTLDELVYSLRLAAEYEGTDRIYCIQIESDMTIDRQLPVPSNVQLAIRANVTLEEGVTLNDGGNWLTMIHGTFTVKGTMNNNAGFYIVRNEYRGELIEGKLVVAEGGAYTGEGVIRVYNTLSDDPEDAISGIDLSGFDKSYDENSGVWTLTPGVEVVLGNVDGNDSVDYFDAMTVMQYFAGLIEESELNVSAADVDNSGTVDFFDAMYILQYFAGLLESLPVTA